MKTSFFDNSRGNFSFCLIKKACNSTEFILYINLFLFILFSSSCNQKKDEAKTIKPDIYYTCSMHPQIMVDKPGNCPICGMKLIQATKSATKNTNEIKLNEQQILLGNIQVETIQNESIGDNVGLTATIGFDQKNISSINARVEGRINKLYFKTTGSYIHKGDRLYEIYSEELNNAKQEYITALERQKILGNAIIDIKGLVNSAKNKLLLWGMQEEQVAELAKTFKSNPNTIFYSNYNGYFVEETIKEGDYVMEGTSLIKIADLSTLWVETQVYSSQMSGIDRNNNATITVPVIPGKEWQGKLEFINPEINEDTRINLVRFTIPNEENQLKPGMPAYVYIKNKQKHSLVLPIDAVLRNANGATIWLQTMPNTFESRMVKTGLETNDKIEITEGLNEGDLVVIRGAYLINSEYIFQRGSNPMEGMDMGNMKQN